MANPWTQFWSDVNGAFIKAVKQTVKEPLSTVRQAHLQTEIEAHEIIMHIVDQCITKLEEHKDSTQKLIDKRQTALETELLAEIKAAMLATEAKYAKPLAERVAEAMPAEKVETKATNGKHSTTHHHRAHK